MKQVITSLEREIEEAPLGTPEEKRAFKQRFLSKAGAIYPLFGQLSQRPPAEKKELGPLINALKTKAVARYEAQQIAEKKQAPPTSQGIDATLPPSYQRCGQVHPLTRMQAQITEIFERIGFVVMDDREVEDDFHNFTALNFPLDHPARQMHDTFFVEQGKDLSLRTHTSSVQVRVLEKGNLPVRMLSLGRVFRNESISARSHCLFHQVEGLYVDEDVSFTDLKATLYYFVEALFGADVKLRFRPSFFPFTEPSAEVDIACQLCAGKGCSLCKHSGWVEIGGAGMVDPHVLEACHVDAKKYRGYAFGMGIERLTMLLYGINDIRLFTENQTAFLSQFKTLWQPQRPQKDPAT